VDALKNTKAFHFVVKRRSYEEDYDEDYPYP
jgi:hypothetical protein